MGANHLDNVTINITLDPATGVEAGFGTVILLVPLATNSLNGIRVVTYTNADAAVADNTAGYISAGTLLAIQRAFSQKPAPAEFKVAYVDLVGAETYASAFTAIDASDSDYYGVTISPRTATEIALVAAAVEARNKVFMFQSADASWLDAGIPAALSAIDAYENTGGIYHDTATEWADVGYLVACLSFDPDVRSAPWDRPVKAVAAYAIAPTDTQKGFLDDNHMNHGLPYGGEAFFVDAGVNMAGRPLYEILTAHWFEARLEERVAAQKVKHSLRGQKITVDKIGQRKIMAECEGQMEIGVTAGHFLDGQTLVTAYDISAADSTAQRIRIHAEAQIAVGARKFVFDINFGRDPVNVEE